MEAELLPIFQLCVCVWGGGGCALLTILYGKDKNLRRSVFAKSYPSNALIDRGFPRHRSPTPEFGAKTYYLTRVLWKMKQIGPSGIQIPRAPWICICNGLFTLHVSGLGPDVTCKKALRASRLVISMGI